MKTIAIASDHAGFEYKEALKAHLEEKGIHIEDFGTHSTEPVDYPSFVRSAAKSVAEGKNEIGIILGGSGNEAIVANRLKGIRCAVVWNKRTAQLAKEHGDCNMIAIGQRQMTEAEAKEIVDLWLTSEFKGGRHQRRINLIDEPKESEPDAVSNG
jgi:ribose 5-phosphate isomerase B